MTPAAQVAMALTAAVSSILIAYLGYRRSKKVDAIAAQAGLDTGSRAGTAQIIEGQNQLIGNLQADNLLLREAARERDELKRRLNRMNRKYGDNGNGNGNGT